MIHLINMKIYNLQLFEIANELNFCNNSFLVIFINQYEIIYFPINLKT
jgi:hypothetical protein